MLSSRRKNWDSDFFGYEVWEITGYDFDYPNLIVELKKLSDNGVKLVYIFSESETSSIIDFGGRLIDRKVLFRKVLNSNSYSSPKIISFIQEDDYTKLIPLSLASGHYSRFRLDSNFRNNEFERLFEEWIKQSVNRTIADEVLAYIDNDIIIGMATISITGKTARIGLIAVEDGHRGKRIGKQLLDAVEDFVMKHDCNTIDVATQTDNIGACLFYKKNGFNIEKEEFVYHIWLNNN